MTEPAMQPPEQQPIGFWTQRAAEAIRTRTRGALQRTIANVGGHAWHW